MKTIFDLGMHEGGDAAFYLAKGFRVIGIDASPQFHAQVLKKFAAWIESGQLVVINKAIAHEGGQKIPFYVRKDSSGWSSIYPEAAERDGGASSVVEVETTTLPELVEEYGVPYFMKCDIEGADDLVATQSAALKIKPNFVSFEISAEEPIITALAEAGYSRFQLVNQGQLPVIRPPRPAREGQYVKWRFDGKTSGLFGDELPQSHWCAEEVLRARFRYWQSLTEAHERNVSRLRQSSLRHFGRMTKRTWLIRSGWMDVHAAL